MTARRVDPQLQFVGLAILVNVLASAAARISPSPTVEFAAALDMTVTVSALYYWLVVRPGLRPKASLLLVALMGITRAAFAFPHTIPGKHIFAGLVETSLLAALIWGRGTIIPARLEQVLRAEFSVFYYALAWWAKPDIPQGATALTLHKKSGFGDLILFVGLASLLEVVPVHLVVAHWSHTIAWILTGLSLYGALWAVAVSRSFHLLPSLISPTEIHIRFGLLFSLTIPVSEIRSISRSALPNATIVPRNSTPDLYLEFAQPLEARLMLGFTKRTQVVGISIDDN